MTNQQKMNLSMTYLLDLFVGLSQSASEAKDTEELETYWIQPLNDISTVIKRLGDSVVLEMDTEKDEAEVSIDKTVESDIEPKGKIDKTQDKVIPKKNNIKKVKDKNVNKRTNK